VDQFLKLNARALFGYLPIRLIFAIMVTPPTKVALEVDD
jgi:hypothetical protein